MNSKEPKRELEDSLDEENLDLGDVPSEFDERYATPTPIPAYSYQAGSQGLTPEALNSLANIRRWDEKFELVSLIRSKYPILYGKYDRMVKENTWQWILEECLRRKHGWAVGKEPIYLRKSKWPGIKSDALRRYTEELATGKERTTQIDKFVLEFISPESVEQAVAAAKLSKVGVNDDFGASAIYNNGIAATSPGISATPAALNGNGCNGSTSSKSAPLKAQDVQNLDTAYLLTNGNTGIHRCVLPIASELNKAPPCTPKQPSNDFDPAPFDSSSLSLDGLQAGTISTSNVQVQNSRPTSAIKDVGDTTSLARLRKQCLRSKIIRNRSQTEYYRLKASLVKRQLEEMDQASGSNSG